MELCSDHLRVLGGSSEHDKKSVPYEHFYFKVKSENTGLVELLLQKYVCKSYQLIYLS